MNGSVTPALLAERWMHRLDLFLRESGLDHHFIRDHLSMSRADYRSLSLGLRLPTWEQLCELSELSGHDPVWFISTQQEIDYDPGTLLVYHLRKAELAGQALWNERRRKEQP